MSEFIGVIITPDGQVDVFTDNKEGMVEVIRALADENQKLRDRIKELELKGPHESA